MNANLQPSTFNSQHPTVSVRPFLGRWTLNVDCWMFTPAPSGRSTDLPLVYHGFRFAPSVATFLRSFGACLLLAPFSGLASGTNSLPEPALNSPDLGLSLLRVLGALALVLAIFFGVVWLIRNWQRLALQRGGGPKLNVLEVRPLGGRHSLYVIGYEQERFLLAASPNGINLLTHLPPVTGEPTAATPAPAGKMSFSQALARVLGGKGVGP